MDRFGYARTIDPAVYTKNKEAADSENRYIFHCLNTDRICIFTDKGVMHTVRVKELPFTKFRDKGTPLDNVCNYSTESERIIFAASMQDVKVHRLLFVSARGMVKAVDGAEFDVTRKTVAATSLADEQDGVAFVGFLDSGDTLVLQSHNDYFLRFAVSEIPEKKKNAIGVRGMKLADGDAVEEAYLLENRTDFTIQYHDRELHLNKLHLAKRDGKGTRPRS